MPTDSMSRNTPAANAESSTLYSAEGSMRPCRSRALAEKNAVTPSGTSSDTGETTALNSPNSGASDPMELTMKNVMASPTSVRNGTAAAMMSSGPGAVAGAGPGKGALACSRPRSAFGSTASDKSGSNVASTLATSEGHARMAQQSSAAADTAHPASTMMARGSSCAYVSNHDMMRMMAKHPDSTRPPTRAPASAASGGYVHRKVPAAMSNVAAATNGVRPSTEGNRRAPKMPARQATNPGSMDAAMAWTAPGAPNAGDSSSTTAQAHMHA